MSWEQMHTIEVAGLKPQQVWQVWSDINSWHRWDTDIEYARLNGPFAEGSVFQLKPKGGPAVKIKLLKVDENKAFTDVTAFPLAKMYGIHAMTETPRGLQISHTVRVEGALGFLWRKLVAEKIVFGLEEQALKMIECARGVNLN